MNLADVPQDDIPSAVAFVVARGTLEEEDFRVLFERQTSDEGRRELVHQLIVERLVDPAWDVDDDGEPIDLAARRTSELLTELRDQASRGELAEQERVSAWSQIATWNRPWPRQLSVFLEELAAI